MHLVRVDVIHPHRLKSAGAHMQSDEGMAHAPSPQRRKNLLVEMQSGGRARLRRPSCARIHGLVALLIRAFRRPVDVGRQRHCAVRLEKSQHVAGELQPEQIPLPCLHARGMAPGQPHRSRPFSVPCWLEVHQRGVRAEHPLEQHLDAAAALLGAENPRGDHARIVEHQQDPQARAGRENRETGGPDALPWRRRAPACAWRSASRRAAAQ